MGLDMSTRSSDGWTEEQQKAISIIPHVTGALSILGSAFIVYDVVSDRKKWSSTYHRLLFGMGLYDFVSSFATALSTVPMPSESGDFSYGNAATCTAQGMFVNLNIASPLYNFMLSIYFLLTVTFRWSKDDVKKKVEVWFHAFPFVWVLMTTIVVLPQNGFNDSSLWCWINSAPKGCAKNNDIECERCQYCEYYRWFFFFIPLWIAAIGTIVAMAMLFYSVRKTEQIAAKWRPETLRTKIEKEVEKWASAVSKELDVPEGEESTTKLGQSRESSISFKPTVRTSITLGALPSEDERKATRRNSRMTRVVAVQAFRYCFVFWITWIPGTTNRILQLATGYSYFWVMLFHVIFTPMQGFWNFLVYIDPRLRKWWKEKEKTLFGGKLTSNPKVFSSRFAEKDKASLASASMDVNAVSMNNDVSLAIVDEKAEEDDHDDDFDENDF